MKRLIVFYLMLFWVVSVNAQININPDPNGDPWVVGGVPETTSEIQSEIDLIPKFTLNPECLTISLPVSVDNSTNSYMRDIFLQKFNSCSQAASVGYMFTYEINYIRGYSSNHDSSTYHPAFTYNFLNYGSVDSGSNIHHGLRILEEMGCPSIQTYGKHIYQAVPKEWITGYEKYDSALHNRISSYETINMLEDSGLFYIKHWLFDHNSLDTTGGLAVFAVKNMYGCNDVVIDDGPEQGKSIIVSCSHTDSSDAHALTIVGYNDSIRFDIDSSGTYEENEIGAFKIANSWDKLWPLSYDSGYCYILYSLFSDDSIFLNGEDAYICYAMGNYEPEITIKAKMTHPNRRWFFNQLGMDTIAGSDTVSGKNALWPISNGISGELPLSGFVAPDDTLEIGIDFSYFLDNDPEINLGKVYFSPWTNSIYYEESMIWYGSVIDNRWGEYFELPFASIPGNMELGLQWNYSVDYDLLPFIIDNDTILITDQIFRLSDTIKSGATLCIGSGHDSTELHLYSASLFIEENANLCMRSWSSLIAKSGTNKIIVKGNLILDDFVTIKAEQGATLLIEFESDTLNWIANKDIFANVSLEGYSLSSWLDSCQIMGSSIHFSSGEVYFTENHCENSTIKVSHPQFSTSSCIITGNHFENNISTTEFAVINIEEYPDFLIEANVILYEANYGIQLFNAGTDARENHTIQDNTIHFTGWPTGNYELGIHAYRSDAVIKNNRISDNDYGIGASMFCDLAILGDSTVEDFTKQPSSWNIFSNYAFR